MLARNLAEIEGDRALRAYGAALAFLNVLTFLHWTRVQPLSYILSPDETAICWPFFPDCDAVRVVSTATLDWVLWVYLAASLMGVALFARRSTTRLAWIVLLALALCKYALVFQDYRLRLNQHYMALWATAVFLFAPRKRHALMYLIVLFYVWAGLLKVSPEWLSGAGLYRRAPLGLPETLWPVACTYVLVLELVLVWGLLARRAWIFWATLAQLLLFHVASWNVVGFFYPLLMFALLTIFPLARLLPDPRGERPTLGALLTGCEPVAIVVLVVVFSFLQLLPFLFPGDTALTGEGRWLALHMFDAPVDCRAEITLHETSGKRVRIPVMTTLLRLPERIKCDPLVYFSVARRYCKTTDQQQRFTDLDLMVDTRRKGGAAHRVVAIDNFCSADLRYTWWRHNDWIANTE